jgi:aspartate aminotransferase
MTITLSHRAQQIKPSPIFQVAALAKQLKNEGKKIIDLSVGEPDFDTPEHIKEACIKALRDGLTKYTPIDGLPELKKAIINKFKKDNNLEYSLKEVMASSGCKQTLFNAILALVNPGEEVLIPSPYWVSYPEMVVTAEGKPVSIPSTISNHFKITADQLEAAITSNTKLLILNSPSNPTGMMYTEKELKDFSEVLIKHPNIYILSDDIYEHILWSKESFRNILNVCPELKTRTIVCHGVSKTYAMTGFRIGFAAGPEEIIKAMTNIQSQSTSCPNSIAQYASYIALEGDQQCVKDMSTTYEKRHQFVYNNINQIPGFKCSFADGAFFCFVDVSEAILQKKLSSDIEFATFLLNEAGIAVVPGSAFGVPNCIRISYATSDILLNEALSNTLRIFKIPR